MTPLPLARKRLCYGPLPGTLRHAASVRPESPSTIETAVRDEGAAEYQSIGTKVSEEEFAALDATARAADMTLSEWVRAVLLAAPEWSFPATRRRSRAG